MTNNPPNSRRNLDIAINKLEKSLANPLQVRTLIANTIIGQLLPEGVVKGGSALKLRYGDDITRFTRDLDAARANELEEFLTGLNESLQTGWQGFTGRIIRIDPAKPRNVPGEYIMQPFEIKLNYVGRSWLTVPLEIGHDEIGDTAEPNYFISNDIVALFIRLGFKAPSPIALLAIHHQIAQKLHALSAQDSERAHDLIDLQLIFSNEDIDFPLVRTTCERLFKFRKAQTWPPVLSKGENWDSLYNAQKYELDVASDVEVAIIWANEFIHAIENA